MCPHSFPPRHTIPFNVHRSPCAAARSINILFGRPYMRLSLPNSILPRGLCPPPPPPGSILMHIDDPSNTPCSPPIETGPIMTPPPPPQYTSRPCRLPRACLVADKPKSATQSPPPLSASFLPSHRPSPPAPIHPTHPHRRRLAAYSTSAYMSMPSQVQTRLRSPKTPSMRDTVGQNLLSACFGPSG